MLDSDFSNLGANINAGARAARGQKIDNMRNAANEFAQAKWFIPLVGEGTSISAGVLQGVKGFNAIRNGDTLGGVGDIVNGVFGGKILRGWTPTDFVDTTLACRSLTVVVRGVCIPFGVCGGVR